jgi:GTP cyclohydrolase I
VNSSKIEQGVRLVLEGLGCDLKDQNFKETPERVARVYRQMFTSPEKGWATFEEQTTDIVLLRSHELYTLCPHHMLPVRLVVSIAYRPVGHVIGLSKLARVLQEVNRGPMLQEAFGKAAVDTLQSLTGCQDAMIRVEGEHGCMRIRGVKAKGNTDVVTEFATGYFLEPEGRKHFYSMLRRY